MITSSFWQNLNQCFTGRVVILEPLHLSHFQELKAAANHPDIWIYLVAPNFETWFELMLAEKQQKQRCPYVVRCIDSQQVIGSTSYNEISEYDRHCAIGYTWYHPNVWGTEVNPDCMFIMLSHAFNTLDLNCIIFKTDSRNIRTQRAIEKLGAVREGVLRQRKILHNGIVRDTVCYSILRSEWPRIKTRLEERLISVENDILVPQQPDNSFRLYK